MSSEFLKNEFQLLVLPLGGQANFHPQTRLFIFHFSGVASFVAALFVRVTQRGIVGSLASLFLAAVEAERRRPSSDDIIFWYRPKFRERRWISARSIELWSPSSCYDFGRPDECECDFWELSWRWQSSAQTHDKQRAGETVLTSPRAVRLTKLLCDVLRNLLIWHSRVIYLFARLLTLSHFWACHVVCWCGVAVKMKSQSSVLWWK